MAAEETLMSCKVYLFISFEHAGLERDIKSLSSFHLKDILRKYEPSPSSTRYHDFKPVWMNKKELINLKTTNNIQKNVIKRLYYNEKNKVGATTDLKVQQLPDINMNNSLFPKMRSITRKLLN